MEGGGGATIRITPPLPPCRAEEETPPAPKSSKSKMGKKQRDKQRHKVGSPPPSPMVV